MNVEYESRIIDQTIASLSDMRSITVADVVGVLEDSAMQQAPAADRPVMVWMCVNGEALQDGLVGIVQRENARRLMNNLPRIAALEAVALMQREQPHATHRAILDALRDFSEYLEARSARLRVEAANLRKYALMRSGSNDPDGALH